ncbi:MAG: CHRD domain-containing protein [Burkholderiales bacterium]
MRSTFSLTSYLKGRQMISLTKTLKYFIFASVVLAAFLAFGNASAAMQDSVTVTLDGAHEVPSNASTATGSGTLTFAADKSVSGNLTTKGIDGTMAHIHEAAAGKNGPVIVKLSKSGADTWSVPPGTKLTDAQYASYKAGNLYVNVHSATIPGGEIRGQLMPK